jgi:hypothetical protein
MTLRDYLLWLGKNPGNLRKHIQDPEGTMEEKDLEQSGRQKLRNAKANPDAVYQAVAGVQNVAIIVC